MRDAHLFVSEWVYVCQCEEVDSRGPRCPMALALQCICFSNSAVNLLIGKRVFDVVHYTFRNSQWERNECVVIVIVIVTTTGFDTLISMGKSNLTAESTPFE